MLVVTNGLAGVRSVKPSTRQSEILEHNGRSVDAALAAHLWAPTMLNASMSAVLDYLLVNVVIPVVGGAVVSWLGVWLFRALRGRPDQDRERGLSACPTREHLGERLEIGHPPGEQHGG